MAKKVIVYSTPACPYCVMVKNFLKQNHVEFTEVDVAADKAKAEELVAKTGRMSVPVTDIGGEIVVGYDTDRLKKLLGI
jgi:glutaredoxin-like YruB-family protein